jgi:transposase-like protein
MKVRITTTVTMRAEAASRTQLARQYKVNRRTFAKWLKRIPDIELEPRQKILTPKQVATIYEYLGSPE